MPSTEQLDHPETLFSKQREDLTTLNPGNLRQRWSSSTWGQRFGVVFSFLTMLTFLLLTLQFAMARGGVVDPDIWWHLRNAEFLLQHHQLPRFDMYSFTVAGHSWINHEWLAEVPYYLAWRAGGLAGIKSLSIVLIGLIFLGLLYLCYKTSGNFKSSVAACCFSTFLATVSFGPRTILFGYVYLIVILII